MTRFVTLVRLVRGRSRTRLLRVLHGHQPFRLVLGAGEQASWPIEAAGLAEAHLDLLWDGSALWVTGRGAPISIDGVPWSGYPRRVWQAELDLADAKLLVDTVFAAQVLALDEPFEERTHLLNPRAVWVGVS